MIPTLIVFGLIFGRWWWQCLLVAALGWPVLLVATGVMDVEAGLVGAIGLAVINTGVGVVLHQFGSRAVRSLRHRRNQTPAR